jgi:hypothetical protein
LMEARRAAAVRAGGLVGNVMRGSSRWDVQGFRGWWGMCGGALRHTNPTDSLQAPPQVGCLPHAGMRRRLVGALLQHTHPSRLTQLPQAVGASPRRQAECQGCQRRPHKVHTRPQAVANASQRRCVRGGQICRYRIYDIYGVQSHAAGCFQTHAASDA